MKLNNKGFAISSIMYIILVMGIILIALTLSIMGSRKLMIDKVKDNVIKEIYHNIGDICFPAKVKTSGNYAGGSYNIGDEYICEVKEGTFYRFFILSLENASGNLITSSTIDKEIAKVNLIMEKNICADGTVTEAGEVCEVVWSSEYNRQGPTTVMNFLYNATKEWINVPPINYTYFDQELQGGSGQYGYKSFISNNGILTITPSSGYSSIIIGNTISPLRARLPIYADKVKYEVLDFNQNNQYLYCYLDDMSLTYGFSPCPNNTMPGIWGYWTLSSDIRDTIRAWYVNPGGSLQSKEVYAYTTGIRPVISFEI